MKPVGWPYGGSGEWVYSVPVSDRFSLAEAETMAREMAREQIGWDGPLKMREVIDGFGQLTREFRCDVAAQEQGR